MKQLLVGIGLVAAAIVAQFGGALGDGRGALAATTGVSVQDNMYASDSITINAGDTVQWTWAGSNQHTVSSNTAEAFNSGAPKSTGTFSHTFASVGTFTYECGVHGSAMSGTVIVQQASTATSTSVPATATAAAATDTPAATNTPRATTTIAATATPMTPTSTNVPSQGAPTQSAATAAAASSPTRAAGAAGATLPRTGDGTGGQSRSAAWLAALLGVVGVLFASMSAGVAALRRR